MAQAETISPSPKSLPAVLRYAIAVVAVAMASGLSLLLQGYDITVTPYLIAIAVTVWFGRIGAGFLAVVLSILCIDYFFLVPIHHIELTLKHIPYFLVFASFGLVISWLAASRRRAQQWLETAVAERTAELRRTAAELEAILDASPVGIALFSLDQVVQRCNPAFERLIGCRGDEILGHQIAMPDASRLQWNACSQKLSQGIACPTMETRLRRRDGTEFEAAVAFAPVRHEQGGSTGFVGTIDDITDRKRAEEALRQARADLERVSRATTLGELTASLSHEIKQPITAAVTNANTCLRWLTRDQPDVVEAREAALRIVKDVTRANEIISHVRLLFKKGEMRREWVNVNEVIEDMLLLLNSEADRYSIEMRTELAADLPTVMADSVQLQQVFMNLMANAIDAMAGTDGARTLTISSQQDDHGQLLFSISDTGMGLPSEKAGEIFNAFFTTKPNGTGMGLSISRSIVESHGGHLWASPNSTRGTVFRFTLPTDRDSDS